MFLFSYWPIIMSKDSRFVSGLAVLCGDNTEAQYDLSKT